MQKLLAKKLCCRKRQQIVARNGNIVGAPVKVAVFGNCRFRQQFVAVFGNFVAWCGQAFRLREKFRCAVAVATCRRAVTAVP